MQNNMINDAQSIRISHREKEDPDLVVVDVQQTGGEADPNTFRINTNRLVNHKDDRETIPDIEGPR